MPRNLDTRNERAASGDQRLFPAGSASSFARGLSLRLLRASQLYLVRPAQIASIGARIVTHIMATPLTDSSLTA
jgi:hypothetical protein